MTAAFPGSLLGGSVSIRPLDVEDAPFLEEMLYEAVWVAHGDARPPRTIVLEPTLRRYIDAWASREGDVGFLAYRSTDGRSLGAVWLRKLQAPGGYGYWDDETPELSMAVSPEARGLGIGTRLLTATISAVACLNAISLSVAPQNPAVRLYERSGFITVASRGGSLVMVRHASCD
ncbi:MAG: GNAT family N-acetyltransferase [Sphingopyxis sp.]|nr:GNAT family N-acetyltransferase [Sphingopyxis sp.]